MTRGRRLIPILFISCLLMACFGGVKKTGKVIGYAPGKVLTKKGYYGVGTLPDSWQRVDFKLALVAFRNDDYAATIATDSFCDQAYDDASLPILTRHLFDGLQNVKVVSQENLMLGERGALRTHLNATLDGVPVALQVVVIKKDWCLFDFYLVAPPAKESLAVPDFETFYRGFSYTGDL